MSVVIKSSAQSIAKIFRLTLYWTGIITLMVTAIPVRAQTNNGSVVTTSRQESLEQRIADLEAYVNNEGRVSDETTKIGGPGPGHNAWLMTSAALVLFMTLPGLALFYGGLVRRKNVLSILAQCLGIAGVVTILWWLIGFSLVFSEGNAFIGGTKYAFLKGINGNPNPDFTPWVSQNVFCMYQMMFAIITPALIIGAIAERMKFISIMLFVVVWMFLVYFPLAHMVWGPNGFMNGLGNENAAIKSIDFAGGTVVHMSSGWSALILCMILGKRIGFGKQSMTPHSMVLCMVGTGILWVGWYGFNAGSALGADAIAGNAFMTTTLAAAVASGTWGLIELVTKGKASILGFCSGAVAGLVVITPACGFVNATSAITIGIIAGAIPYFACVKLKSAIGYDDALDTFGVHAVGGTLGAILTGVFASSEVNPALLGNLSEYVGGNLWIQQVEAVVLTLALSVIATILIALVIKPMVGLRATSEEETQGLDISEHGEEGYVL